MTLSDNINDHRILHSCQIPTPISKLTKKDLRAVDSLIDGKKGFIYLTTKKYSETFTKAGNHYRWYAVYNLYALTYCLSGGGYHN